MTKAVRVLRHATVLGLVSVLVAGMPALVAPALAQSAAQPGPPRLNFNSSAPIEILADSLEVTDQSSSAVFAGNVKVTQADMILRADRLEVTYAGGNIAGGEAGAGPSGIKKIVARGNVFVTAREDTAQGDNAVYDPAAGTVIMTGNVILTRGENVLKGQELTVNLRTGRSVMTGGGGSDGRVKGLIVPEQKSGGQKAQ
ncbi:lipopolysaccharide transport periplasmic protein LptA [Zavarzinia aquatilis]|uniref:Lipopolysaccharide transport periplasmic protein LptA n=1 Tax=Zavarzinia aquatilis TaxID=2211142 RepID=A0A317DYB0_9PROT|nr:lipopolysaccharide transport periplasmic protein LptA [Zavarzinia aquatilis]PWR19462.1 lipopolysaccharide transport periplasmic protein LptA [Zavarzinia aquatilis]